MIVSIGEKIWLRIIGGVYFRCGFVIDVFYCFCINLYFIFYSLFIFLYLVISLLINWLIDGIVWIVFVGYCGNLDCMLVCYCLC